MTKLSDIMSKLDFYHRDWPNRIGDLCPYHSSRCLASLAPITSRVVDDHD